MPTVRAFCLLLRRLRHSRWRLLELAGRFLSNDHGYDSDYIWGGGYIFVFRFVFGVSIYTAMEDTPFYSATGYEDSDLWFAYSVIHS